MEKVDSRESTGEKEFRLSGEKAWNDLGLADGDHRQALTLAKKGAASRAAPIQESEPDQLIVRVQVPKDL
jgi:hypothetical protein